LDCLVYKSGFELRICHRRGEAKPKPRRGVKEFAEKEKEVSAGPKGRTIKINPKAGAGRGW